jgi:trimethylamine--corrinoid protein Co-methyltransferase
MKMDGSLRIDPSIKVLSPEAIAQIHQSSLKILLEIGIRVDSAKAIKYFNAAPGVKFLDEQRLSLQPEIVEWAIQQCPSTITIYNRKGDLIIHLGQDSTRFGIGVTNLFYQDPGTNEICSGPINLDTY